MVGRVPVGDSKKVLELRPGKSCAAVGHVQDSIVRNFGGCCRRIYCISPVGRGLLRHLTKGQNETSEQDGGEQRWAHASTLARERSFDEHAVDTQAVHGE